MTRFQANGLLTITAIIWGTAFVAQKTGMEDVGPFTFIAARFFLSVLAISPLLIREWHRSDAELVKGDRMLLTLLCMAFFGGVSFQQVGLLTTTATNAGFLTGLYALFTPLFAWALFKKRPEWIIWLAAPLCVLGIWLLGDGSVSALRSGDFLVIVSAVFFALHTALAGYILVKLRRPFFLAGLQYGVCALLALLIALAVEDISFAAMGDALPSILYAGLVSGGIAYTLQLVAQQYAPPSDAAIIMSGEALFAAIAGVLLMGDVLSPAGWTGCGVIFIAILSVEIWPLFNRRRK